MFVYRPFIVDIASAAAAVLRVQWLLAALLSNSVAHNHFVYWEVLPAIL